MTTCDVIVDVNYHHGHHFVFCVSCTETNGVLIYC